MATSTTNEYKVGDLVIAPFGLRRIPAVITSIYLRGRLCKVIYMHPDFNNDSSALVSQLERLR